MHVVEDRQTSNGCCVLRYYTAPCPLLSGGGAACAVETPAAPYWCLAAAVRAVYRCSGEVEAEPPVDDGAGPAGWGGCSKVPGDAPGAAMGRTPVMTSRGLYPLAAGVALECPAASRGLVNICAAPLLT